MKITSRHWLLRILLNNYIGWTSLTLLVFITSTCFGQTATEIAKVAISSTISIVALDKNSQPLGYGSGFIVDDDLIVTNVHVIEGSNSINIFSGGKRYKADSFVAIDKKNDLVLLTVPGLIGSKLNLAENQVPEIGARIYAVGNPKGFNGTFSEGIVSSIREDQGAQILQITAPISPGSSGGPVVNATGHVIGIAFASFVGGQNLNFAIPVAYLNSLLTKISTSELISVLKSQTIVSPSLSKPTIKEGAVVRNIEPCYGCSPTMIFFSIKNNLAYPISDIKVLFIVYDNTGTVVDYNEGTYFSSSSVMLNLPGLPATDDSRAIKPFLARSVDFHNTDEQAPRVTLKSGYKVKYRILDFKILDL